MELSNMRIILAVALVVVAAAIGGWDIFAAATGRPLDTVSVTLFDWAVRFPILPLVIGIIIGHCFWPQSRSAADVVQGR